MPRQVLKQFEDCSQKLAHLLKDGARFSQDEEVSIENHLLIVQLALAMSRYSSAKKSESVSKTK